MAKSTSFAGDVAKQIAEFIANRLKGKIPAWAGIGLGAFLSSKVGRSILYAAYKKGLPALAKLEATGIKVSADIIKELINQTLIALGVKMDPKVAAEAESLLHTTHAPQPQEWAEKASEGFEKAAKQTAVVTAACAAGVMIGNYFGKTISAFKGYKKADGWEKVTRILFPAIYTVTDTFEEPAKIAKDELQTKMDEKKAKQISGSDKDDANVQIKTGLDGRTIIRTPFVTPEESGRQVVEHEKGKVNVQKPPKTTSDRMVEFMGKGTNNPEWYKQGKFNGIKCSGTYNYDTKNGNYATSPLPQFVGVNASSKTGLPSVGALQVILTLGKAYNDMLENEFTDIAIKLKALNKNSALTTSWNKADLLALIHNMRVAYAAWCVGRRAYKLVNEFKSTDLTLPYAYFAAMGLDYESWQSARAQIQEDLISMSSRMSVFIDFGKLNLFKRTEQLFEYAYTDSRSIKSQAILFSVNKLTEYFDFNNNMAGTAANVNGDPVTDISSTATGMTYLTWKTNFLAIINSMLDNPKVNDMMSCLRYALGTTKEPLFKIPSPSEKLQFTYDPEVMAQIENCTLLGKTTDVTYTLGISGNWVSETIARTNPITKKIINTHMSDVPKDDEIVLGRLQVAKLLAPGATTPEWYWGTEVAIVFVVITTYATSTNYRQLEYWQYYDQMVLPFHVTSNNDANKVTATEQLTKIGLVSSFDWAPIIQFKFEMGSVTATAVTLTVEGIVNADWENYAIAYDTTVEASLVWMSYLRNGNYSLYSNLQYLLDKVLDQAKTA